MAGVQLGGLTLPSNPLAITPNSNPAPAPAPSSSSAPQSNGVYWVGQDGNVYVKGAQGTNSAGKADANTASYWGSRGFSQIQDPNPGSVNPNTTYSTASTGSGSGTTYQDKSNDIALQQSGLGAVDATQNSGLSAIDKSLGEILGEYNSDLSTAADEYGKQSNANQSDLQTNKQTALEDARSGRQGLFGTLASLGALNGTGLDLANRAVQRGANEDLTTAANTFATNQNGLDTGYNAYTQQEKRLIDKANSAAANDKLQVQNDTAKSRQAYLTNLANDFQAEGDTASAKSYADQASALFPQIAQTNVPTIDLGYSGGAYTAPTLSEYVGKANNTTVQSTPGSGGNSVFNIPGLLAINKRQPAAA